MLILKTIVLVMVIAASCVASGIILLEEEIPFAQQPAAAEHDTDDIPFDGPDEPDLPGPGPPDDELIPDVPEGGHDPAGGVTSGS